jgi:Zn-dependent metalloprotease
VGHAAHVCSIVPARVLRRLYDEARAADKDALMTTLLVSERLRTHRALLGALTRLRAVAGKRRAIFDAGHTQTLPGRQVRKEGGAATRDKAADAAYDNSGTTWDYYREVHDRNSVDARGLRLDSTVHYGVGFDNAFWNGQQMVYGDGHIFHGFAQALDVVGHELTHGVTQYTVPGGGLVYEGQSGALNESVSDVFGSVIKQWLKRQTVDTADWLIGDTIMNPKYGKALRSMKAPGTAGKFDDQPADMSGYVPDGDVHTNSGIPNHAFYFAAAAIGGHAWEKAAPIWYHALSLLHPDATFADAAAATARAAQDLFGAGAVVDAVREAWRAVGVGAPKTRATTKARSRARARSASR